MYNTWTDTHGRTNSYRRTGWHSLIYLYHELLCCLYVLFYPTVTVITPHISPLSHALIQKPWCQWRPHLSASWQSCSRQLVWKPAGRQKHTSPPHPPLRLITPARYWIQNTKQHSVYQSELLYGTDRWTSQHMKAFMGNDRQAHRLPALKDYYPHILKHDINLDVLKSPQKHSRNARKSKFHDIFDWIHQILW